MRQGHLPALVLEAGPAGVGQARRHVRDALVSVGRDTWVDAAELVVSELVTNAVLHAHTEVQVAVDVRADHVRIEVRDANPTLPSRRDYDDHATTGRGLELVAALSLDHGVEARGAEGKTVWACVGDDPADAGMSEDDLLSAWGDAGDGDAEVGVEVLLRGLPPTLWLAAREHHDALLRELALLQLSGATVRADLSAADAARYTISSAVDAAVQGARDRGEVSVPLPQYHPGALPAVPQLLDLCLHVAADRAASFAAMQDALDEAETLARADLLLVRPGLPEIIAVRDWAAEQVIAQLAGSPAARWPGTADDRFADAVDRCDLPLDWDAGRISGSDVGVIAVDQSNRILALSQPLARTLGWSAEELVGRRVVAIVPPRFREAHVAGFSRHLSTGDARALGVDLTLPVLRADGVEVECRFLIESVTSGTGRVVYLAWITPL
ncbi:MAG: putative sensor protein [Frankiales bacterium]|nr:putative sensor protein [Frankiales bacterium]